MARPPLDGVILITGASSGLGVEFARQLAPEARALVLVARRTERLEALRDELVSRHPSLRVVVETRDLSVPTEIEALVERLRQLELPVDVLVNNAGLLDEMGLFEGTRWETLQNMLQVNVMGFTHLLLRLYPPMMERGRGGVLNVSSGFGLVFFPVFAGYSGSKHYVTALTDALRCEASGTGVVVTQVCPGPVKTEFLVAPDNRTAVQVPEWLQISPERCVRQALRAFRAGRAMVVPTWTVWLGVGLGRLTPRWVLRPVFSLVARGIRRRSVPRRVAPA